MKSALLLAGLFASVTAAAQSGPPAAPSVAATDTYFGVTVTDPYRNLENLADPAVASWMKAQSDYARRTLDAIPGRSALIDKIKDFDSRRLPKSAH